MQHLPPEGTPLRDEIDTEQLHELARLGGWLQHLQQGSELAGAALEEQLASAVWQRLDQALLGLDGAATRRAQLDPAVESVSRTVALHAKVRFAGDRPRIEIRTRRAELQRNVRATLNAELAPLELPGKLRDGVREALEGAVREMHGEVLEMRAATHADLAALRDELQQTQRRLQRVLAASEERKPPVTPLPGPPTPPIPEPENPPPPRIYPGPTQPPDPPVPPPSPTPPRDRQ